MFFKQLGFRWCRSAVFVSKPDSLWTIHGRAIWCWDDWLSKWVSISSKQRMSQSHFFFSNFTTYKLVLWPTLSFKISLSSSRVKKIALYFSYLHSLLNTVATWVNKQHHLVVDSVTTGTSTPFDLQKCKCYSPELQPLLNILLAFVIASMCVDMLVIVWFVQVRRVCGHPSRQQPEQVSSVQHGGAGRDSIPLKGAVRSTEDTLSNRRK